MEKRAPLVVAAGLLCAASGAARAEVVSLAPAADATLYQTTDGSLANGAGTAMFAGRTATASNSIRRAVLRFDLASIPAGATITGATLRLFESAANTGTSTVRVFALTQSWTEGTSVATGGQGGGAPAGAGDVTWLHRSRPGSLWSAPGGDFAPAASAATSVGDVGFYEWTGPGLITDVQARLDAPGANFGWLLMGDESAAGTAKRFATREEPTADQRPVLTVTYQVPSPGAAVPLAALAFSRRRR